MFEDFFELETAPAVTAAAVASAITVTRSGVSVRPPRRVRQDVVDDADDADADAGADGNGDTGTGTVVLAGGRRVAMPRPFLVSPAPPSRLASSEDVVDVYPTETTWPPRSSGAAAAVRRYYRVLAMDASALYYHGLERCSALASAVTVVCHPVHLSVLLPCPLCIPGVPSTSAESDDERPVLRRAPAPGPAGPAGQDDVSSGDDTDDEDAEDELDDVYGRFVVFGEAALSSAAVQRLTAATWAVKTPSLSSSSSCSSSSSLGSSSSSSSHRVVVQQPCNVVEMPCTWLIASALWKLDAAILGVAGMIPRAVPAALHDVSGNAVVHVPVSLSAAFRQFGRRGVVHQINAVPQEALPLMNSVMGRAVPAYDTGMFAGVCAKNVERATQVATAYTYDQDVHYWETAAFPRGRGLNHGQRNAVTHDAQGRKHSIGDAPAEVWPSGVMVWFRHGKRWRAGGKPAYAHPSKYVWYFDDGKGLDAGAMDDEPEIMIAQKILMVQDGGEQPWMLASTLRECFALGKTAVKATVHHRDDGMPAVWSHWNAEWCLHGRAHRAGDLPASLSVKVEHIGGVAVQATYATHGKQGRPDHPADVHAPSSVTVVSCCSRLPRCPAGYWRCDNCTMVNTATVADRCSVCHESSDLGFFPPVPPRTAGTAVHAGPECVNTAMARPRLEQTTRYAFRQNNRLCRPDGQPVLFTSSDVETAVVSPPGAAPERPALDPESIHVVTRPSIHHRDLAALTSADEEAARPEEVLPPTRLDPRHLIRANPWVALMMAPQFRTAKTYTCRLRLTRQINYLLQLYVWQRPLYDSACSMCLKAPLLCFFMQEPLR